MKALVIKSHFNIQNLFHFYEDRNTKQAYDKLESKHNCNSNIYD